MAESVLNQQEPKLGSSPDDQQPNNRLFKIVGFLLTGILLSLIIYVLQLSYRNSQSYQLATHIALNASDHGAGNYRAYVKQYKETKIQLDETTKKLEEVNRQLDAVTAELTSTKGMLSQTQEMLAQAQAENSRLKDEIQGMDSIQKQENVNNVNELQNKISTLKKENTQVTGQLAQLKEQLRAFEADFGGIEEGKALISLFQNKIKLVKSRMNYLKQEAYFAKVAAQKEKDRIAALNGNNGFVIKNGQAHQGTVNNKSYSIDVKMVP